MVDMTHPRVHPSSFRSRIWHLPITREEGKEDMFFYILASVVALAAYGSHWATARRYSGQLEQLDRLWRERVDKTRQEGLVAIAAALHSAECCPAHGVGTVFSPWDDGSGTGYPVPGFQFGRNCPDCPPLPGGIKPLYPTIGEAKWAPVSWHGYAVIIRDGPPVYQYEGLGTNGGGTLPFVPYKYKMP